MRRPSSGQNDGDLSRLTSTSSETDSSNNTLSLSSQTYLKDKLSSPQCILQLIDPSEWKQSSRKRKERQDSTSSITQDRKLVRSNSEEHIPTTNTDECDVIRRVSSHEDFKQVAVTPDELILPENFLNANNIPHHQQQHHQQQQQTLPSEIDDSYVIIVDNSKIQNHTKFRLSPVRDVKINKSENIDAGEHEKQRNSERFSKTRATPGRKVQSQKKSKHSNGNKWMKDKDDNSYKYDIGSLKYEKRGFISSKHKNAKNQKENVEQNVVENVGGIIDSCEESSVAVRNTTASDLNDNNINEKIVTNTLKSNNKSINDDRDKLPWNHSFENEGPIVCRRFADNTYDHVNNADDKMMRIYSPAIPHQSNIHHDNDIVDHSSTSSVTSLLHQNKIIRDTIKKPASCYASHDEKIKQINKRLVLLKKRYAQYEESFEVNHGHKPSQNDKMSDKAIKGLVSEISKLRKEKHSLRSDPRNFVHKVNKNKIGDQMGSEFLEGDIKLVQMKETILEIEKVS